MHPARPHRLRSRSLFFLAPTWALLLASALAIMPGAARAQFVDVGASSGATFTGGGRGIAWFDADGDGDQDILTTGRHHRARVPVPEQR